MLISFLLLIKKLSNNFATLSSLTAIPISEFWINVSDTEISLFSPIEIALSIVLLKLLFEIFIFDPEKSNPSPWIFLETNSFITPLQKSKSAPSDNVSNIFNLFKFTFEWVRLIASSASTFKIFKSLTIKLES